MLKRLLVIVGTILSIWLYMGTVIAQESTPADNGTVDTYEVKGEVISKNENTMILETSEGVKELEVDSDVRVTRNTFNSSYDEIQPGDQVTATLSTSNEVLAIDTVSGNIEDTFRSWLPFIIGGILLVGLLSYFWSKSQKGKIKT